MPISVHDAIELMCTLSNEENLRVTVSQTVRGGLMAAGGAIIGGLLAGPVGIAVGGSAASILGAATSSNFKPLATVLKDLPEHRKQELTDRVNKLVKDFNPTDLFMLLATVQGSATLRSQLIASLRDYCTTTLPGTPVQC